MNDTETKRAARYKRSIVQHSPKDHKRWVKAATRLGFANTSEMIRQAVESYIKEQVPTNG